MKRKRVLKAIDKRLQRLDLSLGVTATLWEQRRLAGQERSAEIFREMYRNEKNRYNRLSIYRQEYRAGRERHAL